MQGTWAEPTVALARSKAGGVGIRYTRSENDFYPTPKIAADALFRHSQLHIGSHMFDAGAGEGALMVAAESHGFTCSGIELVERDWPVHLDIRRGDFLQLEEIPAGCDEIVSNPPFGALDDFVKHALHLLPSHGRLHVICRFNAAAAKSRAWWSRHLLQEIILGRVNFLPPGAVDKGKTPMVDFAWLSFAAQPHTNGFHRIHSKEPTEKQRTLLGAGE